MADANVLCKSCKQGDINADLGPHSPFVEYDLDAACGKLPNETAGKDSTFHLAAELVVEV